MALLWIDGFDHYGGNMDNFLLSYTSSTMNQVALSTTTPRTGTHSLRGVTNNLRFFAKTLPGANTVVGVGWSVRVGNLPGAGSHLRILEFYSTVGHQSTLHLMPDGRLRLTRSTSPTANVLADSDSPIPTGTYTHIEVKFTLSNTVGACVIRVDGTEVMNATGLNTGPDTYVTRLDFGMRSGGVGATDTYDIDDLFVWDTTGSTNNDFIGMKRVITLYPSANTATAEWTGTYTSLTSADGDTSYISADASTPVTSEFEIEDLPLGVGQISGIQVNNLSKVSDVGGSTLQASMLSGASAGAGEDRPISTAYSYYDDIFEVDPNTSTAWTSTTINAAKLRLRRTS